MSGPTIDRANSSGDIWTPQVFIDAVEKRFGPIAWDLAASRESAKSTHWIGENTNSLSVNWARLGRDLKCFACVNRLLWLNPPFANIAPWARKCVNEQKQGAEILLLVPASVGANWYWEWVEPFAEVYSVGRMVFDNCFNKQGELVTTPYPKDLILCYYTRYADLSTLPKMQRWRWQDGNS